MTKYVRKHPVTPNGRRPRLVRDTRPAEERVATTHHPLGHGWVARWSRSLDGQFEIMGFWHGDQHTPTMALGREALNILREVLALPQHPTKP